jgi:diguanylate cyclase (GGDEF)-like protein
LRLRLIAPFLVLVALPALLVAVFVFDQPGVIGLTAGALAAALVFAVVALRAIVGHLEPRLHELDYERDRLRESIRRTGQTLASNLDRPALLELALRTAVDAVHANAGRLVTTSSLEKASSDVKVIGSLAGLGHPVEDAEEAALRNGDVGEARSGETLLASVALKPVDREGRLYGLITVARNARPFTNEERELLRLLATQATLALENVDLHYQAVTDELTGLGNYARFQELLTAELEEVKRYGGAVGLLMLDLDDFKSINDNFGHQQGDAVLRAVARVLRESSREADTPVRYGGDELAVILPRTPLQGAFAIGERVRLAIEDLRVPQVGGALALQLTASIGVSASSTGDKDALISGADQALYTAKREGKNRTRKVHSWPADVRGE